MIDDYSYCSRNNKINDLGGKWRDLEEQNRIKQGRYLNKLADTCNQPYTIISAPKSTGKSIIKQYITLGLALFSRVGFGDRRVSDNLLNGQIPADQDVFPMAQARNVPVAPFNLWQQVHNFAMMPKFNDPLRFPSAQAATFHIPTLSGNSDEDIHFELDLLIMHKSMNQGRKEFLRTGVANEKT